MAESDLHWAAQYCVYFASLEDEDLEHAPSVAPPGITEFLRTCLNATVAKAAFQQSADQRIHQHFLAPVAHMPEQQEPQRYLPVGVCSRPLRRLCGWRRPCAS